MKVACSRYGVRGLAGKRHPLRKCLSSLESRALSWVRCTALSLVSSSTACSAGAGFCTSLLILTLLTIF